MSVAEYDRRRLHVLLSRLRALELRIPQPHMRGIHAVAVAAVSDEIHALSGRLRAGDYWRAPIERPSQQVSQQVSRSSAPLPTRGAAAKTGVA